MQQLFKEILLGKISLSEFKGQIYDRPELEIELKKGVYLDLISFNYKQNDSYYELIKFINEKIVLKDQRLHWKIRSVFSKYGWYEGREIEVENYAANDSKSQEIGLKIIKEFGGVKIDSEPQIAGDLGDITFYKTLYAVESKKLGILTFFASIQSSYGNISVDNNGDFYEVDDILSQLYFLRRDFETAMEKILFKKGERRNLLIEIL